MADESICSIVECSNPISRRQLCTGHYRKLLKYGDPEHGRTNALRGEALEFIRTVVLEFESSECLKWPFATSSSGYGVVFVGGKHLVASRYICEIVQGEAPSSKHQAAHSCGNGDEGCVNKNHISWKTPSANEIDKIGHGTKLYGARNHVSKLNPLMVLSMRAETSSSTADKAKSYGVCESTVRRIMRRTTWAWV